MKYIFPTYTKKEFSNIQLFQFKEVSKQSIDQNAKRRCGRESW